MSTQAQARAADERRRKEGYAEVERRAAGRCEHPYPGDFEGRCSGRHEVTHHKLPKKASGIRNPDRHAPLVMKGLCDRCHRAWHAHPAEAYAAGMLIRRPPMPRAPRR